MFSLETIVVVVGVLSVLECLWHYFTRDFSGTAEQLISSVTGKWVVVGVLFGMNLLKIE